MAHRKQAHAVWLLTVFIFCACGGAVGSNNEVKLGVPYRAQDPNSLDCGPASVLMWRLYDGLSEISQQQIADWMGGTSCGAHSDAIAAAVNNFTLTHDAFRDLDGDINYRQFFSRQITSIDNRVPAIAIIRGGLHAGVVNGGKWHTNSYGEYQWDYAYFHDPFTTADDYYTASAWRDTNCPSGSTCEQVVSSSASEAWRYNLDSYGGNVVMGGGGGDWGCGGPCQY